MWNSHSNRPLGCSPFCERMALPNKIANKKIINKNKKIKQADPVQACDGFTYERAAIEEWFLRHQNVDVASPMTGKILENRTLVSNIALRIAIDEFVFRYQVYPYATK